MTSQPGYETIAMHMLSRNKCNQTTILSQLIEYSMKNIFLKKSYAKCGGETIPRPFPENSKLSTSLDQ